MPDRCIAGYRSNTHKDGFSLFPFPQKTLFLEKWTRQLRRTPGDGQTQTVRAIDPGERPPRTAHCCAHFTPDCFDSTRAPSVSVGCAVRFKNLLLACLMRWQTLKVETVESQIIGLWFFPLADLRGHPPPISFYFIPVGLPMCTRMNNFICLFFNAYCQRAINESKKYMNSKLHRVKKKIDLFRWKMPVRGWKIAIY